MEREKKRVQLRREWKEMRWSRGDDGAVLALCRFGGRAFLAVSLQLLQCAHKTALIRAQDLCQTHSRLLQGLTRWEEEWC